MRNKLFFVALVLSIGIMILGCTAFKRGSKASSMLMDLDPTITGEDKAIPESLQPVPIPAESFPLAEPGEPKPSAMLMDLEVLVRQETIQTPQKVEEAQPIPIPEEPKSSKEKK